MEDKNSKEKEINLLQLIDSMFDWLKKIGNKLVHFLGESVKLTYRHILLISMSIVMVGFLGFLLSSTKMRVYKADSIAKVYGSDVSVFKEVCKQLEMAVGDSSEISFAKKLSLPINVAENIVAFQTFYVIDYMNDEVPDEIDYSKSHSLKDTMNVRMQDRLCVRIKTRNISQLPLVQAAILRYFEKQPILKTQFETSKLHLVDQINICDRESQRIDSMAKINYFERQLQQVSLANNKLMVGNQDKQFFYNELLGLSNLKERTQKRLDEFKMPVNFVEDFVVNPSPENGRIKYLAISIVIGYILGLILSVLVENFKKIMSFLKS